MTVVEAVGDQLHPIDLRDRRRTPWRRVAGVEEHVVEESEVIDPWLRGASGELDRRAR